MRATLSPLFTWRSAIAMSELPPTPTLVAFTLSLHMNERGGSCYPAVTTIASECRLSERSVRSGIRTLEEEGWLITEPRKGRSTGAGWTNRYHARIPAAFAAFASNPAERDIEYRQLTTGNPAPAAPKGVKEGVKEGVEDLNLNDHCPECGLRFPGPRTLSKHLKNVHDIEQEVPA